MNQTKKQVRDRYGDMLRMALAVRGAAAFSCTIFADRGHHTYYFATLKEARAFRPRLERAANNHRKALVYAISAERQCELITDAFNGE